MKLAIILTILISLSACAPSGRYSMKHDKAPLRKPTTIEMQDAIPKVEPIYPWSIKPYTVLGKRYRPLKTAEGYHTEGVASWYGRKFHGHTTANGETYDMFAMTAAHKTLPIPSYVRVTNLANDKSIIVRVNDRGPFHHNRIIDLSYSAAYAIDMLAQGTAKVRVEALIPKATQPKTTATPKIKAPMPEPCIEAMESTQQQTKPTEQSAAKPQAEPQLESQQITQVIEKPEKKKPKQPELIQSLFVQVVASGNGDKIQALAKQLSEQYKQQSVVIDNQGLHILRLGPLQSEPQAEALAEALKNNGYSGAYKLYTQPQLPHN